MLRRLGFYGVMTLFFWTTASLGQRINREFLFSKLKPGFEVSDQEDPQGYLNNHWQQIAYPGNPDLSFIDNMMKQAVRAQTAINFRGRSEGVSGQWFFVGPEVMNVPDDERGWDFTPWSSTQGRLTDLAISRQCQKSNCRLFVGSASGGLWRTERALANPKALGWKRIGAGLGSGNIGSITIDPNDSSERTVYVGTGENNSNFTSGAGLGLYRSTDGGDTFTRMATMILDPAVSQAPIDFTATRGISQVAVHPSDPSTLYVATVTAMLGMTSVRGGQSTITGGPQGQPGLYRTTDGGASWELLIAAPTQTFSSDATPEGLYEFVFGVKDVRLDPTDPTTVYASVLDDGLYRSSPSLEGGDASFKPVFPLQTPDSRGSYAAFDLAVKDGVTRAYVYNGIGAIGSLGALYRADDVSVPASQLANAGALTPAWNNLSSSNISDLPAFVSGNLCASQCVYDLFVESPDGHPDMVYMGGNLTKLTGNPVLRSTDGGVTFTAMGFDLQTPTEATHVDVRAAVVDPHNPGVLFVGGDGGLTRTDGEFGVGSHLCQDFVNARGFGYAPGSLGDLACRAEFALLPNRITQLNEGLVAMQLFNIAGDPRNPTARLIAGTQDNSTHVYDGIDGTTSPKTWSLLFGFGDGTSASGFHSADPNILFASFQSNWYFVNFRNGGKLSSMTQDGFGNPISYSELPATMSWLYTGAPIYLSGERSTPTAFVSGRQFITFDPSFPNTQFTGFESVWRTANNGGDRAFLEANCSIYRVFYVGAPQFSQCGDWKPLGTRLSDPSFGDREGGTVVAAERSRGDDQTLWAGTSLGRLFVSKNVNNPDHTQVVFVRLDASAGLPRRFVSGLAVDDQDPNVAYVSYSGFDAIEAGAHVYRVTYDPATETASATALDYNLPDYPVNHIVRDDPTGDLYIANDFGVLTLPSQATEWEQAGTGLRSVLVPHLEIHPEHRKLLIGTFGLGAWYLNLP